MSTILDALRRLQRERAGDLHEAVAVDGPANEAEPRRWLLPVALLLLLLASTGTAAWFVWPGAAWIEQTWLSSVDPGPSGADLVVATRAAAPPEPAQAREATPVVDQAALEQARQQVAQRRAQAMERARKRAEQGRVGKPPAEPVASAQAAALPPELAPVAARRPTSPPFLNAPEPMPVERPRLDLHIELEPPLLTSVEEVSEAGAVVVSSFPAFPDLSVERVQWHPDPERREARILLGATRPVDAREGDIIAGVSVHRIDPGAVEMRIGKLSRLFPIGP